MSEKSAVTRRADSEFVAFIIGAQDFCIDIMSVREIRGWTQATVLPHAPSFVRGVINLRGAVLPVIDLAERLGFPPTIPTARHVNIVVQIERKIAGLLVDAVSDILKYNKSDIQPTPDVGTDTAKSFLRGVIASEGRMISLVGLDNMMPVLAEEAL